MQEIFQMTKDCHKGLIFLVLLKQVVFISRVPCFELELALHVYDYIGANKGKE